MPPKREKKRRRRTSWTSHKNKKKHRHYYNILCFGGDSLGQDAPVTRWDMRLPMDPLIYRALEDVLGRKAGDEATGLCRDVGDVGSEGCGNGVFLGIFMDFWERFGEGVDKCWSSSKGVRLGIWGARSWNLLIHFGELQQIMFWVFGLLRKKPFGRLLFSC